MSSNLDGTLQRVVFQNTESQWTVAKFAVESSSIPVTIVGSLLGVAVGTPLRLRGEWVVDPRFGKQFRIDSYQAKSPETLVGMERYLGSGLIPGIGPELAKRIVTHFGQETMDVIRDQPQRLGEVEGIGAARVDKIRSGWSVQQDLQEAMVFLRGYGVHTGLAARICKRYGRDTVGVVRQNPYRLAVEVAGIGFRTADAIAQMLGISKQAPARLEAGLIHVLGERAEEGHVHVRRQELITGATQLLHCDTDVLEEALDRLLRAKLVVQEALGDIGLCVSLASMWEHEHQSAQRLAELLATPMSSMSSDWQSVLEIFERKVGYQLAKEQRRAVQAGARDKCIVITGGPGVGKTTIIRGLVHLLRQENRSIALAAPTGRAANRLSEAARQPAVTLHRLLEYQPRTGSFQRHQNNPLDFDTVIVDEVSMLDIAMFRYLLEAIANRAQLILVGDVDQLPSVGPGAVLADVMASGAVTVIRLTEIFRQAQESQIVMNAHQVNRGYMPEHQATNQATPGDFYFIEREDPISTRDTVLQLVTERIPKRFGLDPIQGVQVLSPMHRGELGTAALNLDLQSRLNPQEKSDAQLVRGERVFRSGDKVMQVRNDYDKSVFNGDIGIIRTIVPKDNILHVEYPGSRLVPYERADMEDLVLAYVISVHKSQGSEYPAVVIPLSTQHYMMLQRNLLYTAITRGKQLVCIVGAKKAVRMAVQNATTRGRGTWLAQRIAVAAGL